MRHLYLFGSTARDEARLDSDIDLFFEPADPRFSLVELVRVTRMVSDLLGAKADLMTRDSLNPAFRDRIEATAVRVFPLMRCRSTTGMLDDGNSAALRCSCALTGLVVVGHVGCPCPA